ncbi:MAG: YraN family protein [Halioglobus sp.]
MKSIGNKFEDRATQLLAAQGLKILARNYAAKTGEIDIIALENNCLVFLEVRARSNRHYASAAASVDRRKQQRILRTAQYFLKANPKWAQAACRFDVIAFEPQNSTKELSANWIKSAFTA